jgi:hypothetical protein
MMPLCTTAARPSYEVCGWALVSFGTPWVAHRVCPTPTPSTGIGDASSAPARLAIFPARLTTAIRLPESPDVTTATPAESYPRYSRRFRPAMITSAARPDPTYPTMPHMAVRLPVSLGGFGDFGT